MAGEAHPLEGRAPPQHDVRDALRAVTLQTVRTLTLWMGPLFLLFAPFDYYFSGPQGMVLAALDLCIGALYLAVHFVGRTRVLAGARAHLAAGLVAFAAL